MARDAIIRIAQAEAQADKIEKDAHETAEGIIKKAESEAENIAKTANENVRGIIEKRRSEATAAAVRNIEARERAANEKARRLDASAKDKKIILSVLNELVRHTS